MLQNTKCESSSSLVVITIYYTLMKIQSMIDNRPLFTFVTMEIISRRLQKKVSSYRIVEDVEESVDQRNRL